jgi:hypothetical protein
MDPDHDGDIRGRCITGSNQVSVVVQITDSCPECPADHIDIQAMTFDKVLAFPLRRLPPTLKVIVAF